MDGKFKTLHLNFNPLLLALGEEIEKTYSKMSEGGSLAIAKRSYANTVVDQNVFKHS